MQAVLLLATQAQTLGQAVAVNFTQTLSFCLAIAAMGLLVVYRIFKKHKQGKVETRWDFLDRNLVEVGLIALGGGSAGNALLNLFGGG